VRRVARGALDQLLVDRAGLGERVGAEVRQPEQGEHARVVGLQRQRLAERALREVDLALLELLAAAHDGLFEGFAIARVPHGAD
jgi:hypothetical protein